MGEQLEAREWNRAEPEVEHISGGRVGRWQVGQVDLCFLEVRREYETEATGSNKATQQPDNQRANKDWPVIGEV